MHFASVIAAAAVLAPLVAAHGDGPSIPKIFGMSNPKDLKARALFTNVGARGAQLAEVDHHEKHPVAEKRATNENVDGQCGPAYGSCAEGTCCSPSGYCGTTSDYCYSPGCLYDYGPGCPENITPAGTNTSSVDRSQLGSLQYGGNGIYECTEPGTIALTYDDGPALNYTDHILDLLVSYNAVATFFITGNNLAKGEIDLSANGFVATIQRMYANGNQIASHTWTHLDLSAITSSQRRDQMVKNEMALRNILGFFPTYMRPPYSSCTAASGCESDLAALGYHTVYFNVDTDDYEHDDPNKIQTSKNWFYGNITAGSPVPSATEWLSIAHDIHAQTAYNLTEYTLQTALALGYRTVTVGECLGDPAANWYRSSSGTVASKISTTTSATSTAIASPTAVSLDGTCGGTTGSSCTGSIFGNCCSPAGWCGSTTAYCGTDCQSSFGTCGLSSSSVVTTSVASSTGGASPNSIGTSTASSAAPSASLPISTDATCGGTSGQTCQGSSFGNCCSSAGWCGSTSSYCSIGCQSRFGSCTVSSSSISAVSSVQASSSVQVSSSIAAVSSVQASSSSTTSTTKASSTTTSTTKASSTTTNASSTTTSTTKASSTTTKASSTTTSTTTSPTKTSSTTKASSTTTSTTTSTTKASSTTTKASSTTTNASSTTTKPSSTTTKPSSTTISTTTSTTKASSTTTKASSTTTNASSTTTKPSSTTTKPSSTTISTTTSTTKASSTTTKASSTTTASSTATSTSTPTSNSLLDPLWDLLNGLHFW